MHSPGFLDDNIDVNDATLVCMCVGVGGGAADWAPAPH